jgi:hypothetical protein
MLFFGRNECRKLLAVAEEQSMHVGLKTVNKLSSKVDIGQKTIIRTFSIFAEAFGGISAIILQSAFLAFYFTLSAFWPGPLQSNNFVMTIEAYTVWNWSKIIHLCTRYGQISNVHINTGCINLVGRATKTRDRIFIIHCSWGTID